MVGLRNFKSLLMNQHFERLSWIFISEYSPFYNIDERPYIFKVYKDFNELCELFFLLSVIINVKHVLMFQ